MQVLLIILSVVLLGLIINYAVSRKSSRVLRLAALIALGLIGLSLGVASILIAVNGFDNDAEESHLPIFIDAPRETSNNRGNLVEIIIFLVILSVIIGLIVIIASRDHKKKLAEAKKPGASPLFPTAGKTGDLNLKAEEPHDKAKEDDTFNLELD